LFLLLFWASERPNVRAPRCCAPTLPCCAPPSPPRPAVPRQTRHRPRALPCPRHTRRRPMPPPPSRRAAAPLRRPRAPTPPPPPPRRAAAPPRSAAAPPPPARAQRRCAPTQRPHAALQRSFTRHSSPPYTIQMKQRSHYLLHGFAGHLTYRTEGIEGVSSGSKVRRHTIQQVAHRGGTQCNPWMKMYPAPKTISRRKHQ